LRCCGFFPSRSASKNLSIFTQKIVSKLSEIRSELFIPDPDFFTDPGSQIEGSKRHRIPDPQHWIFDTKPMLSEGWSKRRRGWRRRRGGCWRTRGSGSRRPEKREMAPKFSRHFANFNF
jgi:hypothetical protein